MTSDVTLAKRADVLKRFLLAMDQGIKAAHADPAGAAASMIRNWQGAPALPIVTAQVVATNASTTSAPGQAAGWLDAASITGALDLLRSEEETLTPKPPAAFFDNSLLP